MTREVLNRMPENVKFVLETLRKDYKNAALDKAEVRCRAAGYTQGLRDAGFITERERQILFVYTTV